MVCMPMISPSGRLAYLWPPHSRHGPIRTTNFSFQRRSRWEESPSLGSFSFVVIKKRVFEGRLCRPITFGNDGIMAYQWKKLYAMRPLRSSWYAHLVMKYNIRGARPGCPQVRHRREKRAITSSVTSTTALLLPNRIYYDIIPSR